ncbi:hypothetical protein P4O66_011616 [Electrophorus voltai]|uniref:Uncharacterized protein n=1 Tax=Electrophorus voltai TaxID=2609070 RepID=A0AAD8Z618_9TELE|nr:hypothetical protein P4O66_011616 [Electrophorus voltai]
MTITPFPPVVQGPDRINGSIIDNGRGQGVEETVLGMGKCCGTLIRPMVMGSLDGQSAPENTRFSKLICIHPSTERKFKLGQEGWCTITTGFGSQQLALMQRDRHCISVGSHSHVNAIWKGGRYQESLSICLVPEKGHWQKGRDLAKCLLFHVEETHLRGSSSGCFSAPGCTASADCLAFFTLLSCGTTGPLNE